MTKQEVIDKLKPILGSYLLPNNSTVVRWKHSDKMTISCGDRMLFVHYYPIDFSVPLELVSNIILNDSMLQIIHTDKFNDLLTINLWETNK